MGFSSTEAEFNKLNSVIIEDKPKPNELKKSQSGNDVILNMFSSEPAKIEVIKPQKIEKNELEKKNDPFSSIEAEFNSLNNEFDKIQKQQSGNDVVLDMFSSENETNENVKEENVELKPDNDPFAELDMSPNEMFIAPKDEQMNDAKHRKKEDANDPFASLDMAASDIFNSPQKKEKNEKDESAMGVLGGLLSANPEFGNNENIFGGNKEQNNVESNFVDFKKYESVKESKKFDKNDPTLTKIEDVDQYKIVSVKETIISDDGNGNIETTIQEKMNENEIKNQEANELNDILQKENAKNIVMKTDDDDEKNENVIKALPHQTIDIDNFMKSENVIKKYEADDVKEEYEDDLSEDDDVESMGSEIIHGTPRQSEVIHQKLDSEIFGGGDDDDEEDESTSSSSEAESQSNGTDPNGY